MKSLSMRLLAWLIVAILVCAGPLRADTPIQVVALSTVLSEIAHEVGGNLAAINTLVKAGVDPHSFDPSATDIRAIVEADIVFASGLHLESYLDKLVANVGTKNRLVSVGDAVPMILSIDKEKDPHWWHSIDNVIFATDLVCQEYSRLRPKSAETFTRNAHAYQQRLVELKIWVSRELAQLPPARRQLVTSHDAFGYLARDYRFTVHAISGFSDDGEPDARHVARLIDLIRKNHIAAIFAESSVNPQLIQNLVRETGARLGGVLYTDGLGPVDSDAATYETMYRHNISVLVSGLMGNPRR